MPKCPTASRALLSFVLSCSLAGAWGPEGHQLVGRTAALNLRANAAAQVAAILGVRVESLPDEMAHAATWGDTVRSSAPETGGWHFVDIPRDQPNGKPADFCPNGDCVTFRIADFIDRLQKDQPGPDKWKRPDQLRFLIHFVGDIHQPLHCATNSDKGANCLSVPAIQNGNLHHVWDSEILNGFGAAEDVLAEQFTTAFRAMSESQRTALLAGSAEDWALASHQLALSKAYGGVKPPIPIIKPQIEIRNCATEAPKQVLALKLKLPQSYFEQSDPIVRDQLMKAGIRLANVLNTMWP